MVDLLICIFCSYYNGCTLSKLLQSVVVEVIAVILGFHLSQVSVCEWLSKRKNLKWEKLIMKISGSKVLSSEQSEVTPTCPPSTRENNSYQIMQSVFLLLNFAQNCSNQWLHTWQLDTGSLAAVNFKFWKEKAIIISAWNVVKILSRVCRNYECLWHSFYCSWDRQILKMPQAFFMMLVAS